MTRILLINNEADPVVTDWIAVLKGSFLGAGAESVNVVHYSELGDPEAYAGQYDCLVLSGREKIWDPELIEEDYGREIDLIRANEKPAMGICAGMQLIGVAFEADFGRMIDGEDTIQEEGFVEISRLCDDDLFKGLNRSFPCFCFHGDELKTMPRGFKMLAKSSKCAIQAIRHREKPIYGVQFHPEKWNEQHLDGARIIRNFLRMAGESASV